MPRTPAPALLIALVVRLGALVACATNPVTGEREFVLISESQEIAMGRDADAQIQAEMGIYDDPELQRYVSDIGLRLASLSERPGLPWTFTVVDQPAVNAFALPGGFIYLTRGILPFLDDEAELAGVLGHEIGHVTARHSVSQYSRSVGGQLLLGAAGAFVPATRPFSGLSQQALGLAFLRYGREDELQSDSLGARYAATGGWDPAGVPGMLGTLGRLSEASGDRKGVPNFLSTHPEPLARVGEVTPQVEQLRAGRTGLVTGRDALLRRVDGLIYGDNPAQGVTRGSTFLHPPLRFRIDFPDVWPVANSARQVVSQAPAGDAVMLLQQVEAPQGTSVRDVAITGMRNAGFQAGEGERTTIDGLDAYVGAYRGQIEGLGDTAIRAAHILHNGAYYLVAGLVAPENFQRLDSTFLQSIRSFRRLSDAEAAEIRPQRIDLYVVRSGDTWASIAERSGGHVSAATLAVMNHASPDSRPAVGARIKIVT
jgi:predicted Zn-dependent protease